MRVDGLSPGRLAHVGPLCLVECLGCRDLALVDISSEVDGLAFARGANKLPGQRGEFPALCSGLQRDNGKFDSAGIRVHQEVTNLTEGFARAAFDLGGRKLAGSSNFMRHPACRVRTASGSALIRFCAWIGFGARA